MTEQIQPQLNKYQSVQTQNSHYNQYMEADEDDYAEPI